MSKPMIGDREVRVKELTVAEIRRWLLEMDATAQEFDLVGGMLFADVDLATLARMSDVSTEEIEEAKPSELRELARKCQEVNSHFFSMAGRMGKLLSLGNPDHSEPGDSNEPAQPSSD